MIIEERGDQFEKAAMDVELVVCGLVSTRDRISCHSCQKVCLIELDEHIHCDGLNVNSPFFHPDCPV